jgi:hypothetical protein
MNSQIQYTHLGDNVTFYQTMETPNHPSSNNGIINFKGHSLKKIDQPNRVITCRQPTERENPDNIFRCIQPNCYFSCKDIDIADTQNNNNVLTAQQIQWLDKDKANGVLPWVEFNIKQQIADKLFAIMTVDGFDKNNPQFTKKEIAKNIHLQTNIQLNEDYVKNLLLDTNNLQQPCPYLNSILDQNMLTPQEIITTKGVNIIKKLITDIMKQQGININLNTNDNNFYLHGNIVGDTPAPIRLVYNLKYLVDNSDTASQALASLIKEVDFDKILIKLSRVYPQAFDRNSDVFINSWNWNDKTITFGYKNHFTDDCDNNNLFQSTKVYIDSFCDIENMIFNFDLLKVVLNATPNLSYDKLFQADVCPSFLRLISGEKIAPIGLLSPDMFARLPV